VRIIPLGLFLLGLGALSASTSLLAATALAAWAAPAVRYRDQLFDQVAVTYDVPYGAAPGEHGRPETLALDIYQPFGDAQARRPAVVWVHGGGFVEGDKGDRAMVELATSFAGRGYVAVSINYRLREGRAPYIDDGPAFWTAARDARDDAQAAVRWLRAHAAAYGIDPERIAIGGLSAGGVTALLVNYSTDGAGAGGTAAAIDISGRMDASLIGPGDPPVLVIHGTEDAWVPFDAALDVCDRAAQVGVSCELRPLAGAGHDVWPAFASIDRWSRDFLYEALIADG
jgi:acetyl esterase/lipase